MHFHLDLNTGISTELIQHRQKLLLMGSCFSEHIGKRLNDLKFDCRSNPFGIVFNPLSMHKALSRIVDQEEFTDSDIMEYKGSWLSPEAHSSLNKATKAELLDTMNAITADWHERLKSADWLLLTFGSAYYYVLNDSGSIVANCHKLPAKRFTKKLAEPSAIIDPYQALLDKLRVLNPGLRVILTVSPVKHLRDGVVENNLSKSILCLSSHSIVNTSGNSFYFPAYELVSDDLRDYRFYEADMAHPSRQAIDYVWQKFSGSYFDESTRTLLDRITALNAAYNHRPLQPDTQAFVDFKKAQLQQCKRLQQEFPYLDLQQETAYFLRT